MLIESLKNNSIKNIILLQQKRKEREWQNQFLVEGIQENYWAIESNFSANEFFICQKIFNNQISLPKNAKISFISNEVFEKVAYRKSTGGIIGLYKTKKNLLTELKLNPNPVILVLESIEKPGNLGAILRGAEAAGVDAVFLSDSLVDLYNPNVIRSSVGTVFLVPVISSTYLEIQKWLMKENVKSYATCLDASSQSLYHFDYKKSTAFVFGTESTGLTKKWLDFCSEKIIIPMNGKIDSLNVSNATSICVFEAMRQRR